MLQRAASNAYSWWWASHIRTKQSKWLDTDLEEMGERMQSMIKIIDEEGDSFARKAEMYFKKRPELLESVEQTYKAYRALAEKYDHISSELHKANHTIATAFPDQIEFDMQDEECASLNLGKAISSGKLGKPSAGVPRIGIPNKNKKKETERSALKKSRLARVASQRSKAKAQDEIDKLQKGILVLQTEKEYIRTSYESGVAKYSDIERQITEMQEDVFSLQDAYSANAVIEDDAARTLMTATALRSCESSLAKLQEQQKRVMEETKIEMEKVKKINAKESKIHQSSEEVTNEEEESIIEPASLCEHIEISSDVSVEELAEKINELVSKVISYEMSASSQTAQMKRMSAEIDVLHRHLLNSDEDKRALTNDVNSLCERLLEAQEELKRMQHVEEKLKRKLKRMQQAEEERKRTQEVKESVLIASEEAISIQNEKAVPSVSVTTVEEAINSVQNETAGPSTTTTTSVTNEEAISAQNEIMAAPSISMTDKEAISISVQNEEAAGSSTSVTEKEEAISIKNEKPIEHSEAEDGSKQAQVTPQVVKQAGVVEISSSQSADHVELSNASKLQLETNHSENSSGFEDNWTTRFKERDEEVKITSQDSIHQSKKFSPKLKKSVVGHSEVKNNPSNEENVKAESIKSQVAEQEDRIHGNATESKLQFEQDPDASLNSLQSLVNKLQGKEKKIILTQLESTFRNYRDTKKKLSEIEKQNQEHNIEISKQIRELKSSNAMKDAEIHTLRKNLRSLQLKSTGTARISDPLVFESEPRQATSLEDNNFEPHTISVIEEKFRQDVDTVLEENLEFWLRFNSSSQNRQLFQTTFEDIQAEIDSLKLKKSGGEGSNHKKSGGEGSNHKKSGGEGSNHSNAAGKQANLESLLIEKKLKELKTEIHVWLEQNALLQGELESKYSSLSNIQEEISATLEASLEGNIEEEGLVFAPYQAAKFQGELLNIQLENNKVSEELMAGMEDARELQGEIENTLARLHGKKLPKALESAGDGSNKDPLRHSSTKNQVPLRSFLFSQKPKRKSMFSKVNPALQIRMAGRGRGRGGGGGRGRGRSSS